MDKEKILAGLRAHYRYGELLETDVDPDPLVQFNRWLNEAILDNLFEPNALSLATVGADGQPSCRTVLLKGVLQEGLIFYTNYSSKKARQVENGGKAAMLYWWREHERQVRVEGLVERVPRELSEDYFNERPKGSRISAIISPQSEIVENREVLENLYLEAEEKYEDADPECPSYWGGYILKPQLFEFWQGRPNRLHDRLEYRLSGSEKEREWTIVRLAP